MVDIVTCDTAIATARIKAPETIGIRVVNGHGLPSDASEPCSPEQPQSASPAWLIGRAHGRA
jgi:hypothetical protein